MRRFIRYSLMLGLAVPFIFAAHTARTQDAEVLVIEGGTLIDGSGGQPVRDSVIIIRGNRIEAVSRKGQASVPPGAKVLQADGKFIVPGLMDAHVHYADYMGEAMLNHGVTSIFEIGGGQELVLALRKAINAGKVAGPRIFLAVGSLAGAAIAAVQGRTGLEGPLSGRQVIDTAEKGREAAKRFIAAGADMVKVHRGPSFEVYKAAIEEAHQAKLPVVAQPLGPTVYAREAVMAGADILEHAAGIEYSIAKDPAKAKDWGSIEAHSVDASLWADMDESKAAEMIQLLVQHRVSLEPDLVCKGRGLFAGHGERIKFELQDWQLLSKPQIAYIPENRRQKWLRNYYEFDDMDPAYRERRVKGLQNMMKFILQFSKAGGHVLTGTDSPGWAVPGLGLHHEFELQVEAGFTPMQVIMNSTRNIAEAFRLNNKLGAIEPGKLADLVVVNDDPLQDIANLRKIEWVFKDGKQVNGGYNRWYKTPFQGVGVQALAWALALKSQTLQEDPSWAFGNPPPGILSISPAIVTEGDPAKKAIIKGFNFTIHAVVYAGDEPVHTRVISPTEIEATLPKELLEKPATLNITVRNPEPVQRPEWGNGASNIANLLVDYRY